MTEQWRDVIGFDGAYQVSNTGLVRSVDRYINNKGARQFLRGKVMRQQSLPKGHRYVVFCRNGKHEQALTHRLVLEAFAGPCPDGMECCHNDGDSSNNLLSNLRWDTRSNNMRDNVKHGKHAFANKTHCPQGHPYDAANTFYQQNRRNCRACHNKRSAEQYARKVAKS